MFSVDPTRRPSFTEILYHPWLTEGVADYQTTILPHFTQRLTMMVGTQGATTEEDEAELQELEHYNAHNHQNAPADNQPQEGPVNAVPQEVNNQEPTMVVESQQEENPNNDQDNKNESQEDIFYEIKKYTKTRGGQSRSGTDSESPKDKLDKDLGEILTSDFF